MKSNNRILMGANNESTVIQPNGVLLKMPKKYKLQLAQSADTGIGRITNSYNQFLFSRVDDGISGTIYKSLSNHFNFETEGHQISFLDHSIEIDEGAELDLERKIDTTSRYKIYANFQEFNKTTGEINKRNMFVGNMPKMDKNGVFIVNGVKKVIIGQLEIASGIYYEYDNDIGKSFYQCTLQPTNGPWLKFADHGEMLTLKINKSKRTNGLFLLYTLGLRDPEIFEAFHTKHWCKYIGDDLYIKLDEDGKKFLTGTRALVAIENIIDFNAPYNKGTFRRLEKAGIEWILTTDEMLSNPSILRNIKPENEFIAFDIHNSIIYNSLLQLKTQEKLDISIEDACKYLWNCSNPGETYRQEIELYGQKIIKDFSFAAIGRYNMNRRFDDCDNLPDWFTSTLEFRTDELNATVQDIILAIGGLILVRNKVIKYDDLCVITDRRAVLPGEVTARHFDSALYKVSELLKRQYTNTESIRDYKFDIDDWTIARTVSQEINQFFAQSKAVQFLEESNPLASLYYTLRLTAATEFGTSHFQERCRDIYDSSFGAYDPIGTVDGKSVGLILNLCSSAILDKYGYAHTIGDIAEITAIENKINY